MLPGKSILIIVCICVCVYVSMYVALVIQHAKRMHHILLLPVACLAVPYFAPLLHKRHDFRKRVIEHKRFVSIFSTTYVGNFYRKEMSEVLSQMYVVLRVKYLLFLSYFKET